MMESREAAHPIHAAIAVWHRGAKTFYVQRSAKMANYPLVWSLMSVQFDPATLNPLDTAAVQALMERMARERLCGTRLRVAKYLSSANCADNPMRRRVFLHLHEVELLEEPRLNADYYVDSAWLEPAEYEARSSGATCGLCMRMWSDYCVRNRLTDRRFAPVVPPEDDDEAAA
jgi:hypothetical protein